MSEGPSVLFAFCALMLLVRWQEGHLACKWAVGCWHGYLFAARCRLAYGPTDATATHCLFASVKSRLVLPFWYWLTQVVLDKGPLNGCVCVCVCVFQKGVSRSVCSILSVCTFYEQINNIKWQKNTDPQSAFIALPIVDIQRTIVSTESTHTHARTHTHTHLTALCPGLPGWAGTRKVKPIWILLKQETVSGSGIRLAICKSAHRSRQITTPAPHHSVFLQAGCPSCRPTNSVKALKADSKTAMVWNYENADCSFKK